jgi:ethanolamine utilization protein EutN
MFIGRVVGSVWSTVKWPEVGGLKLLAVQPYHLGDLVPLGEEPPPACHDLVVCADVLGAGIGEDVVIAYGHAARVALEESLGPAELPSHPIDAAVVAIVDRLDVDSSSVADSAAGEEQAHE